MAKPQFSSVALPAHDTPDIPGRSPVSYRSEERTVFSPLIRTSSTNSTTEKLGRLASLKGILFQAKKSGNPPPSGYHSDCKSWASLMLLIPCSTLRCSYRGQNVGRFEIVL